MRYEVLCREEHCSGPTVLWTDTEGEAREIARLHERETGHQVSVLPAPGGALTGPACHYAASWATLQTVPPCPPCSTAVTHVWPQYHRGRDKEMFGPDIFLCTGHAAWLMNHDVAAIRHIVLRLPAAPPADERGG